MPSFIRKRLGLASTARQAGEGHKRIDSTVSVRALPGGIFMRYSDFENTAAKAIATATAEHKLPTEPIPTLTPVKLAHLVALLASGKENTWYNSGDWQAVRDAVKRIDHECIICKTAGRHSVTRYVHHVKHLRDRPDLALSIYDPDTGERQLICVCKQCHELLHPESQRQYRPSKPPITAERWD